MSEHNGGPTPPYAEVAARLVDESQAHIERLRQTMRAEGESRVELERLVHASRERERKLARAISALGGNVVPAAATPAAKPARTRKGAPQPVKPEVADEVLEVIRRLIGSGAETVTRPQLVEAIPDRSPETVRRGLNLLREQERIRLVRTQGQGPRATRFYALMPDVD